MAGRDQIRIIMRGLDRYIADQVRDLGLEVTANLQERTPVDLRWAASNWIPAIGAPQAIVNDGKPTPGAVTVAMARQAQGVASLSRYRSIAQGSIFVSNNAPYIRRLNEGWSKQAPSGFVQIEIKRAIRTVKARWRGRR